MTEHEKKLLQAKHRLEEAQARDRVKERKARTRRLIQEGALLFFPEGRTYSPPRRGGGISCGNRALCEANAAAAAASRQCHSTCKCCCHRLRRSQLFPFWKQSAPCPHKPATGSFICGYGYRLPQYPFSFCEKETKTRAKGR